VVIDHHPVVALGATDLHDAARDRSPAQLPCPRRIHNVTEDEQVEATAQMLEQPVAARADAPARRPQAAPGTIAPSNGALSGVLSGDCDNTFGTESLPTVHQRARERVAPRERKHRVAKRPRDRAFRRDEIGRACGAARCSRRRPPTRSRS
jgi:hypothetical protein